MKCGQALSLRMTHCSVCGTPASHAAAAQSFAALPPVAPRQALSDSYEQPGYTQPPQREQNSGMNYAVSLPTAISSGTMQLQPTQKRRWSGLFLLAIVVCILLLFGIGAYKLVRIANATSTVKQANTPSGNALVPSASLMLKDAQTSSAIDTTLAPAQITKTFMANQKVYITFTITSGKLNGSIEAKWYADGQVVASTVLHHSHENTHAVFSNIYVTATPDGAVELYWCTHADCKDAQLAQVVHFIVTPIATTYVHASQGEISTLQRH